MIWETVHLSFRFQNWCVRGFHTLTSDDLTPLLTYNKDRLKIDSIWSLHILTIRHLSKIPIWRYFNYNVAKGTCRLIIKNPPNDKTYSLEFVNNYRRQADSIVTPEGSKTNEADPAKSREHWQSHGSHRHSVPSSVWFQTLPGLVSLKRTLQQSQPLCLQESSTMQLFVQNWRMNSKADVIPPVVQPTQWVIALVVTHKKIGKLSINIDHRELNIAQQREHYTLPNLEETFHESGQSKECSQSRSAIWILPCPPRSWVESSGHVSDTLW